MRLTLFLLCAIVSFAIQGMAGPRATSRSYPELEDGLERIGKTRVPSRRIGCRDMIVYLKQELR